MFAIFLVMTIIIYQFGEIFWIELYFCNKVNAVFEGEKNYVSSAYLNILGNQEYYLYIIRTAVDPGSTLEGHHLFFLYNSCS